MAVSNRFNRLTAEQLDDCIDAFRILEEEGIGRVGNMDSVSKATTALARHGVAAFQSVEERNSLKASAQQALSRQEVKDAPTAPPAAGSSLQEGIKSGQKADNEEAQKGDGSESQPSAGRHAASDLYNKRAALLETVRRGYVKLVRGEYLIDLDKRGEKVQRQQDLPKEAFATFEELQSTDVEIVALSYCWCSKGHPDPDRFHLPLVVKMVKAMMAGKYVGDFRDFEDSHGGLHTSWQLRDAGFTFGASAVAIFWDFMSLPQAPRQPSEQEVFDRALSSINGWYGSRCIAKWVLKGLPEGLTRAPYDKAGWTCFEWQVANIVSPPSKMLVLAGDAEKVLTVTEDAYAPDDFIKIALRASQAGARSGPMEPDAFDKVLDGLTFTNGADCEKVKPKYREAFHILVDGATSMSFHGYHMTTGSVEQALKLVLGRCHHLEALDLGMNPGWEKGLDALAQAVAAAPCFRTIQLLDLSDNKQVHGEVGSLSDLKFLRTLNLVFASKVSGNVVSLAPLVKLQKLMLASTQVSGDVMGLAPLLKLQELNLWGTQVVGDFDALEQQLPKLSDFTHR